MKIFPESPHFLQSEVGAHVNHGAPGTYALATPAHDKVPLNTDISVRLITSDTDRMLAENLVNRMYAWRGYGSNHRLPNTKYSMTFIAESGRKIVGTLTLTVDSLYGLELDRTFSSDLAEFRAIPDTRICELSKFAFDHSVQSISLLATMFHTIFLHGSQFNCTDLFIEINPRHRRFYESMLCFKRIGEVKTNHFVSAPSQLMWCRVESIRHNIELSNLSIARNGRSLYNLFPASGPEHGIHLPPSPQAHNRPLT